MPVLANSKHERFAQALAKGLSATKAYISAGYSKAGAKQNAARLLTNADLCARIKELQEALAAGTIALEISRRNCRIQSYQRNWVRLQRALDLLLDARGEELKDIPGGASGLLYRDYKGKGADRPVYKVDPAITELVAELRALGRQAAEDLGQWVQKREDANVSRILWERMGAARRRLIALGLEPLEPAPPLELAAGAPDCKA
jgi:hypothetical protein